MNINYYSDASQKARPLEPARMLRWERVMDGGDSVGLLDGTMLGAWLGLLLRLESVGLSLGISDGNGRGHRPVGATMLGVMDGESNGLLDGTMLGAWLGLQEIEKCDSCL